MGVHFLFWGVFNMYEGEKTMDTLQLIKYFNCQTTEKEEQEIFDWLADDPDGSHQEIYHSTRMIWSGLALHAPESAVEIPAFEKKRKRTGGWKYVFRTVSGIAAAILLVAGTVFFTKNRTQEDFSSRTLVASVPVGQTFELVLEDGTSMFMNSGTKVEYPALFSKDCRKVKVLQGEVLFDVTKDEERPFIVETFTSEIKVLGTKFNVAVEPEKEYCSTALLRGRVQIESRYQEESVILDPNMVASFDHGRMTVSRFSDQSAVTDWTKGLIDLQDIRFEDLMKKYEKVFNVKIVIEREQVPEISYTRGKIRVSDGVGHAMEVLQMASDFQYYRDFETNTIYIR